MLEEKKCIPCSGEIPPLPLDKRKEFLTQIHGDWQLTVDNTRLRRELSFKNFEDPLNLTNKIGQLAEEEWHHPEIHLGYGHLHIEIWTHKINSLVESDFIFAAKVDKIVREYGRTE